MVWYVESSEGARDVASEYSSESALCAGGVPVYACDCTSDCTLCIADSVCCEVLCSSSEVYVSVYEVSEYSVVSPSCVVEGVKVGYLDSVGGTD